MASDEAAWLARVIHLSLEVFPPPIRSRVFAEAAARVQGELARSVSSQVPAIDADPDKTPVQGLFPSRKMTEPGGIRVPPYTPTRKS